MKLLAALAVACFVLAGCSSAKPLPPEWKGRDLDEPGWNNLTIRANWTYSMEYYLPTGRTLTWDWVAMTDGYLYFQLARNGQTAPLRSGHGNEGKGSFTTTSTGVYILSWGLDGLPDTVLWHNLPEGGAPQHWPPGEGPACPPFGRFTVC